MSNNGYDNNAKFHKCSCGILVKYAVHTGFQDGLGFLRLLELAKLSFAVMFVGKCDLLAGTRDASWLRKIRGRFEKLNAPPNIFLVLLHFALISAIAKRKKEKRRRRKSRNPGGTDYKSHTVFFCFFFLLTDARKQSSYSSAQNNIKTNDFGIQTLKN